MRQEKRQRPAARTTNTARTKTERPFPQHPYPAFHIATTGILERSFLEPAAPVTGLTGLMVSILNNRVGLDFKMRGWVKITVIE